MGVTHGSPVARSAAAVSQRIDLLASFTGLGRARGAGRDMAQLAVPTGSTRPAALGRNLSWTAVLPRQKKGLGRGKNQAGQEPFPHPRHCVRKNEPGREQRMEIVLGSDGGAGFGMACREGGS